METVESLNWLKSNSLYELSRQYSFYLKKVFMPCLAVQDEKILIIGDRGFENRNASAILSGAYYLAAKELNLDAKLILQGIKARGDLAEDVVIASLADLNEGSVIFLNMSDKLGNIGQLGKSFRRWVKKKQHRFVSAMSLGDLLNYNINLLTEAIDVNYKPMQLEHEKIRKLLDNAKEIHITTAAGTDLYYNIEGISSIAADGNYTQRGSGGNLPAGEVYIAPNGKKVEGRVVIDGSSRNHTRTTLIKEPIILVIEEGAIVEIQGGKEAKELENTLEWAEAMSKHPGSIRRICEFGLGLNPRAKIVGATIIDDKVKGTAHIGIGSNYWFGGSIYAILHLDQIFRNPKIFLDGKELEV
jgi:hypothetical protein